MPVRSSAVLLVCLPVTLLACNANEGDDGAGGAAGVTTTVGTGTTTASTGGTGGGPGACPTDAVPGDGIVVTDHGAVQGTAVGETYAYRGIPYAAPPVGNLRWRPPAPATCFDGVFDASAYGPVCPQNDKMTGEVIGNEDCLRLDVFTPKAGGAEPRPIMLWIHGGGFQYGSSSNESFGVNLYDPQRVVERTGAIVVTINYRLGPLGWLAHPRLAAEDPNGSTGNYGHLDQIAAIAWVKANARAFGGDPERIMIYGESAGGASVCNLVASPLASGLFSAAAMQSGGCFAATREKADEVGANVFAGGGCGDAADPVACMRALPTADVIDAYPVQVEVAGAQVYGAVIDGWAMPDVPRLLIERGEHNHVPWIIGQNANETSRDVPLPRTATEAQYEAAVTAQFAALAPTVLAQYPAADYESPWAAYVALTSDAKFVCGARRAARAASAAQSEPVYRYHFTHAIGTPTLAPLGAWHGIDILFVFGQLGLGGYTPTASERALSDAMIDAWSRLAATGNPDGSGIPAWPHYDESDPFLGLDDTITVGAGVRTAQCDFWDGLIP